MTWRTLVSSRCLGGRRYLSWRAPHEKRDAFRSAAVCLAQKKKEKRGAEISLPAGSPRLPVPSTCAGSAGSPPKAHPSLFPSQPPNPALAWVEGNSS